MIDAQVIRRSIGGDLLINPLQDRDLPPQFLEVLLSLAAPTFGQPRAESIDQKRSAEHAFVASHKVGGTPKNQMRPHNHAAFSQPDDHEAC